MVKIVNQFDKREKRAGLVCPPSKVQTLGAVDLGKRIQAMLDHGKLIAENLAQEGEYDEDEKAWKDYSSSDEPEFDPTNEPLDKLDALDLASSTRHAIKKGVESAFDEFQQQEKSKGVALSDDTQGDKV